MPVSPAQQLYDRGIQARNEGEGERAKRLWAAAIRHEPQNAQFHASLAHQYTKEDNLSAAIPSWREAVKYRPTEPKFVNGLGAALQRAEQYHEATQCFQHARSLDTENPIYAKNLAECRAAYAAFERENELCGYLLSRMRSNG